MEKFKEIKKIGDGSFGTVTKAMNIQTHELVAIKKLKQKYNSWDDCMNLRELKALKKLQHPNIIKLKEVIRLNDMLSFIFEFAEKNVYQAYTNFKDQGKYMPENEIKSLMFQSTSALAYMHKHGFFHRDLKPENILVNNEGVLKIIDFGLAREIRSRPPYTDYVATRWYRAPEILLQQTNYNSPVDVFALGCIMCELYLNRPMFSGTSEMDQLNKILSVLGTFSQNDWTEGHRMMSQKGMTLAQYPTIPMNTIITNASPDAINLINQMLRWDPNKRITAAQMLQHPFFLNVSLPHVLTSPQKPQQEVEEPFTVQRQQQPVKEKEKFTSATISDPIYPYLPSSKQRQSGQERQEYTSQRQDEDLLYHPSFATNFNHKKENNSDTFARHMSSERIRRIDPPQTDTSMNQYRSKQETREDIDEMLDFINSTTTGNMKDPIITTLTTGDILNQQNVKSSVRLNRSIYDSTNMQSLSNDREPDNSTGADYGGYLPSQMNRKPVNQIFGQMNGLIMPQQQTKTLNSIYNFDNVAYRPEQNPRQRQGGGGMQMPKQF